MIIPDINILIYAINIDYEHHEKARVWFESAMTGDEPIGLSWIVVLGFIRIITNGKIMNTPIDMDAAFSIVDEWLDYSTVQIIEPTDSHWKIFKELLSPLSTAGNLTSDAHLAALAIEHAGCLYSTDRDFQRFKGLRWENPLEM